MNGVLLTAGRGTRLRPLTNELDKAMIPVGYQSEDPLTNLTEGIPAIEFSFASLALAGIEHIAIVQNENRAVQRKYPDGIEPEALLIRQGRWDEALRGTIAPYVTVSYAVQPKRFIHNGQEKYGTGIWPLLLGDQIEQWINDGATQFLVSEGDSLLYNPNGSTPITKLVSTAEKDPNMAAILLLPINKNASPDYGFAGVENVNGQLYFIGVQETKNHPLLVATRGGTIEKNKNVTRAVVNLPLYRHLQENAEAEPPEVNEGETHILDGYRKYLAVGGKIEPVISDPGEEFINFGDPDSLRYANYILRGMLQNPPVWDHRKAA